jgi:glycosyltransferase involved in cell wall biosynthesis
LSRRELSMIERPRLTVVIPTRNRPDLIEGAIDSALGQSLPDIEVVVVDDASTPAVALKLRDSVRCVRLDHQSGHAAARNAGLAVADGRWVTFLDDDDRLLPHMAEASLNAIRNSTLPPPVAVISGIEAVGENGRVLDRRIPPTHPRGEHFILEPLPPGCSHMTKNTLVADRDLLRALGGFDPSFRSREMSDLFLRLNPVCSIVGVPTITYRQSRKPAPRMSRNTAALEEGFWRLVAKHRALFDSHPEAYADALLGHARMSLVAGPRRAVIPSIARALGVAPRHTLGVVVNPARVMQLIRTWTASG